MSVHLQNHMHLASTFLGEHSTHRAEGTFGSMHVIIHGRRFMRTRSHSGKSQWKMPCTSLINLERRQSKTVGCQAVKLNLSEQKVDIPLVVAADTVCLQALKDRLVATLRQAVASRAVGNHPVHSNFETLCQLFPRLGLEQLVSNGNNLSGASFESNHFAEESVNKVVSCHVLAARDEHSTSQKPVHHSDDGMVASRGRQQS